MLILQNISYVHPNKDLVFENLHWTVNKNKKVALIGQNGVGKSTLLKIIAGQLLPTTGHLKVEMTPFYIPQIFGQFNHLTIAQALQIEDKIRALKDIIEGQVTEKNLTILGDDWSIEDRCTEAMNYWGLSSFDLNEKLENLSGGQKTKIFLASISIHQPALVLLDEPSNHLDNAGRQLLYDFIQSTTSTLITVSHDRTLLNLLDSINELSKRGITTYGGNFDFYKEQKQIEIEALNQDIQSKEKTLQKAKKVERETIERQQKLDARGKKKHEKEGVPRIMMNTLKNNAEKTTAKIKSIHTEKIGDISQDLQELRSHLSDISKMKFGFDNSALYKGKILFTAENINFSYHTHLLWKENKSLQITSGERMVLKGSNGSGKTTLIKIILGQLEPTIGTVHRAANKSVYIDQDYSLIDNTLSVYEQACNFNSSNLQEHEVKIRLNRFLFSKDSWDKPCSALSGGEKMRLMLCCLTIKSHSPDIIILDEPTNNLDIHNIEILTAAINEYQGTLIVVSHDDFFLKQINAERTEMLG